MKKILLISDTHGYMGKDILKYVSECDEVWHAGDIGSLEVSETLKNLKSLRAVHGNIDNSEIRIEFKAEEEFTIEGLKVWITHIGGYPGNYAKNVESKLKEISPDLFICGHSHILKIMKDKKLNLIHMNPGAIGKYGFHNIRTMIRFEVSNGNIDNVEVIEFKR
tara:strand:- start:4637 stop:5128 length:492 start_codon:yes stop_codon:yes gene_type:complete